MQKIKELLKEEAGRSVQFQNQNFGLFIGDGYREMVEEMLESNSIANLLLIGVLNSLSALDDLRQSEEQPKDKHEAKQLFIKHLPMFKGQLDMLYWGIQVGRKLEREQSELLGPSSDVEEAKPKKSDPVFFVSKPPQCPICGKPIGIGDVLEYRNGPHALCTDPKLTAHERITRNVDGNEEIGYIRDGTEYWVGSSALEVKGD